MTYPHNLDDHSMLINLVDYTIVANSDAVGAVATLHLCTTMWMWILSKSLYGVNNLTHLDRSNTPEIFLIPFEWLVWINSETR